MTDFINVGNKYINKNNIELILWENLNTLTIKIILKELTNFKKEKGKTNSYTSYPAVIEYSFLNTNLVQVWMDKYFYDFLKVGKFFINKDCITSIIVEQEKKGYYILFLISSYSHINYNDTEYMIIPNVIVSPIYETEKEAYNFIEQNLMYSIVSSKVIN